MPNWTRLLPAALASAIACGDAEGRRTNGSTLVVAVGADEYPLLLNRDRVARYPLNASVCEALGRLTTDFRAAPSLARRWEYRGDNVFRFVLAPVKFSDGRPLTTRAVAFTLRNAIASRNDYAFLADTSLRVVDDTTIDIRPARPNLRLPAQLLHPTYGVVDPGSDPTTRPVCSGPFAVVEYAPQRHLTVARNPRYRGAPARSDTIVFRFVPDEHTRVLALRSGAVDMAADLGRASTAALGRDARFRVAASPVGAVLVAYLNLHGPPPFDLLRSDTLRRAVAMSIDRRTLVQRVMEGPPYGHEVATVNPPAVLAPYDTLVPGVPYDPAGAARLLDAAGWRRGADGMRRRGGRALALTIIAHPHAIERSVTEYVQAQLVAAGIAARVETMDAAAYGSRLNAGQFDVDLEMPNQNDANPAFLLALRWYSRSNTRSVRYTHASPRYDALIEEALAVAPDDDAALRRRAAAAMRQLLDVEVAAIPLAGISRVYVLRDGVRGFVPHPSRLNQDWSGVWMQR